MLGFAWLFPRSFAVPEMVGWTDGGLTWWNGGDTVFGKFDHHIPVSDDRAPQRYVDLRSGRGVGDGVIGFQ